MPEHITESRAARRFHQVAVLERQLARKVAEVNDCVAHLKDLKEEYKGLILRLRAAARDEGELPLFDLDGDE
jgi:hypothetical protein